MVDQVTLFWGFAFAIVVAVRWLSYRQNALQRQVANLARVEAKLDLIMANLGIKYDPFANFPQDVRNALLDGKKIEAIKLYRKAKSVGLKEAKDIVEDYAAKMAPAQLRN